MKKQIELLEMRSTVSEASSTLHGINGEEEEIRWWGGKHSLILIHSNKTIQSEAQRDKRKQNRILVNYGTIS